MKKTVMMGVILSLAIVSNGQQPFKYPVTKKVNQVDDYYGNKVPDPYRWLEDDNSAETAKWVVEQNKLTQSYLSKIPYRNQIKDCLTNIWNFPKYSVPFWAGKRMLFYMNNGLQNQSALYIKDNPEAEQRLFLDPNELSSDGTVSIGTVSVSKNNDYVAFATSASGSDWQTIRIKKITGEMLEDQIPWVKFSSIAWFGNGFFYSRYEKPKGSELSVKNEFHKVYYHKLGTKYTEDQLIYENEKYPLRNYTAMVTEDERYLIISETESTSGNALRVKDLRKQDSEWIVLVGDFNADYDLIGNADDDLYFHTNANAPRYKVVRVNPLNSNTPDFIDVIPQNDMVLQSTTMAGNRLVTVYMRNASSAAFIYNTSGQLEKEIEVPGIGTMSSVSGEKDNSVVFMSFTTFTQPATIYKMDVNIGIPEVLFKPDMKHVFPEFITEQVFYPSKDGTQIPMFIVYKKGIKLDGTNPTLLYGYGGFNISLTPNFSISRMLFLENGGIYAVANLRGGGEFGKEWHQAGTILKKQNVFDDFISAAEYLINNKYTSSSKLAIQGGSNGGLLVGACITQRPELFKVALPAVGVMDMLRYHKFTIGWAWKDDYGTSEDKDQFYYLKGYSPLHNIRKGVKYPATLVTTADHDDRVVPAHSFKFAAALQAAQAGNNPVLIRIETKAGHGAGKPTSKSIEEAADIWAFTFYNLGIKFTNPCQLPKKIDPLRPVDKAKLTPSVKPKTKLKPKR